MNNFDVNIDACVRKTINLGKICPKFKNGEYCEECAVSEQLFNEAKKKEDKVLLEDAKSLYARSRVFVNALNINDEDKTFPVHIYIFPPKVYDDLMAMMKSQRQLDPKFNIFHPITGRNVLITRKGTTKLTTYTPAFDINVSQLVNEALLERLKNNDFSALHDLSKVEEFISAGYLHMKQFEPGTNVIRLLPPYDGLTIYKELKFHRITVSQLQAFKEKDNHDQAVITSQKPYTAPQAQKALKDNEFDPFDLPDSALTPTGTDSITLSVSDDDTLRQIGELAS